MNKQSQTADKG